MNEFLSAPQIGTGGARTLPREHFVSSGIFQLEAERIFGRRWLCAGRQEQVAEPGRYFLCEVAGESILIVGDPERGVRAYYNVCRHRGTRLCEAPAGQLGHSIQCPYHAWTYDLDGRLRAAPGSDGCAGFNPSELSLHPVAVALWEGFVFVSLAQQPEPFERSHAALLGRFSRYQMPRLKAQRQIDYDVRANWKLIFQNYSECYHCPPVHPSLARLTPAESGKNDLVSGPFLGGYMELSAGADSLTQSGHAASIPVADLPAEDQRRVYYYTIFPNLLLSLHRDYVMAHTLWPLAVDRTRIVCQWLFHPDASSQPGFNPDDAVRLWDQTNREDWHICEQSQLGISSRVYAPGPYLPRESLSAAFDREVLKALE